MNLQTQRALWEIKRTEKRAKQPEFVITVDGKGWLARAVIGREQVTGAWSSDPYDALARVVGFVRARGGKP